MYLTLGCHIGGGWRVFVKIDLVIYGIREGALVIQEETGIHRIYLSLYANHHFEPHLEKFKLYIFRHDASYNYRYLNIMRCELFFFVFYTRHKFKFSRI